VVTQHSDWVLGFADEVWWSRLAQPDLHAWSEEVSLRLVSSSLPKDDPDPKALACYGLLRTDTRQMLLRFVDGRPVSHITTQMLAWLAECLAKDGKKALLLVWDNASWHLSREVRNWVKNHNRQAKREGGLRFLICQLPVKSPWLNPIEPRWVHGKRAVVEPEGPLTAQELKKRICAYFRCDLLPPLAQEVL
jgi:transposase